LDGILRAPKGIRHRDCCPPGPARQFVAEDRREKKRRSSLMKKVLTFGAVLVVAGAAAVALAFAGDTNSTGTATETKKACCAGKTAMAGKNCPADSASKGPATKVGQEVTLTGKVLCERCDLGKSATCAPVLKADGRDGYLKICPTSNDLPGLKKAGTVEVKGYVRPGTDGQEEIEVISFDKKQSKVS
jgi:hypothetical protein